MNESPTVETASPLLPPDRIERARQEKRRYLLTILILVLMNLAALVTGRMPGQWQAVSQIISVMVIPIYMGLAVFIWRFARTMNMGIPATVATLIVSYLWWFVGAAVLLRVYGKRTGIPIAFWLYDKDQKSEPRVPDVR